MIIGRLVTRKSVFVNFSVVRSLLRKMAKSISLDVAIYAQCKTTICHGVYVSSNSCHNIMMPLIV